MTELPMYKQRLLLNRLNWASRTLAESCPCRTRSCYFPGVTAAIATLVHETEFVSLCSGCPSSFGHMRAQMKQNKMHLRGRSRQDGVPPSPQNVPQTSPEESKPPLLATHPSSRWAYPSPGTRQSLTFHDFVSATQKYHPPPHRRKPQMTENRETVSHHWGDLGWTYWTKIHIIQCLKKHYWKQMTNSTSIL